MAWQQYLIWFLIAGLAVIVGPGGNTEITKVIVAEVGILTLVVAAIVQNRIPWRRYWIQGLIALFILLTSQISGALGNQFRLQGWFLALMLLAWSIVVGQFRKAIPPWASGLGLVVILMGAVVFAPNAAGRAVGTLGEPNALASAAAFIWTQLVFTSWSWAAVVLAGVTVGLAQSRSAVVAMVMQLGWWITSIKKGWGWAAGLVGLIWLGALTLPFLESQKTWEDRVDVWKTAWLAGWQRPWLGWGFGNITLALTQTASANNLLTQYQFVDSAHNLFLDWWVQGGVGGVTAIGGLIAVALVRFGQRRQLAYLLGMLGLVGTLSFNPASVVSLVQLWWLIGLGWAQQFNRSDHHS